MKFNDGKILATKYSNTSDLASAHACRVKAAFSKQTGGIQYRIRSKWIFGYRNVHDMNSRHVETCGTLLAISTRVNLIYAQSRGLQNSESRKHDEKSGL